MRHEPAMSQWWPVSGKFFRLFLKKTPKIHLFEVAWPLHLESSTEN